MKKHAAKIRKARNCDGGSRCVQRMVRRRRRRNPTLKEWKEYDRACKRGEVPSGGWCNCCETYACGRGGVNHT